MAHPRCEDCRWWDSSCQPADKEPDTHGVCRVSPPVADDRTGHARWPFTEYADWCASFVLPVPPKPSCASQDGCIKGTQCERRNECLFGEIEF